MAHLDRDPVLPWRIPPVVIAFLIIVIVLITLAAIGTVAAAVLGTGLGGFRGFDLSWPDGEIAQMAWIQGALMLITMFLVWLFSILVVAAHVSGSHRNAATNAVAMVRVSIAIMVVRYAASALIPYVATGYWGAGLTVLASGLPLLLAQVALLIAADAYFCAVRENAPS